MTINEDIVRTALQNGASLRIHSGHVRPGDVFVALPGSRVDGARFIDDAVAAGASIIIHDARARVVQQASVLYWPVESPIQTLGQLARKAFGVETPPRVIGVTGTNGKTTTAYLLRNLLTANGHVCGLIGTVSCSWPGVDIPASMTTPDILSLHELIKRMARANVDTVIMEISSHALHQERIAGLPVDIGVFSNLTQDHLDYHHDMESYFAAKARLFLDARLACARGVVNVDDAYGQRLKAARPDLLSFGVEAEDAELRGQVLESGSWGLRLALTHAGRNWELRSGLIGRYNVYNLLACVGVGVLLGLEPKEMDCLGVATGAPGRLERVPNTQGLDIFIDYAHTPDALEKVSHALKNMGFSRLITVFGCGGDRDAGKRPLMGQAAARYADVLVLTSDNPRSEDPESILDQIEPGVSGAPCVLRESNRRLAIGLALKLLQPGDALLIAGKGHECTQVIGTTVYPFSDFEVVREQLL